MFPRLCSLPPKKSVLLLGPRQTGKSTLVRATVEAEAWSVDLLQQEVALRYAKDPAAFRREAEEQIRRGVRTVVVDEVQRVPLLLDEIHRLIEKEKKVRFVLTGSSARKIRRGGANLLAGRAVLRHLFPLTAKEQGSHFDLDHNLRFGSLPTVIDASSEDAEDFLAAYANVYLREEIQAESLVRNLGGFARFLDVAAAQCGEILNASSVGRDAMLATRTVQEYYQILEDTLLGFRLEAWRKSVRARMVVHPKFYLFDTGITNAINRRLTASLDPSARGRLFEQWVVVECGRLLSYAQSEARLYYWRTNHGAEVDLLFEKHGRLVFAAEIKAKTRVATADLTGLRSFAEAHPQVPCYVVALVPEAYRLGDASVLPYRQFFDESLGFL